MKNNNPLQELESLILEEIISMPKIEWWLLKYKEAYKVSKYVERQENTFIDVDEEATYLPSLSKPTVEEKLIEVYEALERLSNYYRNEQYYKNQLLKYEVIKHNSEEVKANEEKYKAENYLLFFVDYLDYEINNEEYHLKLSFHKSPNCELFVNRMDFIHTINFLEIFNTLYWVD